MSRGRKCDGAKAFGVVKTGCGRRPQPPMFVFRQHRKGAAIFGDEFEGVGSSPDALQELRIKGR